MSATLTKALAALASRLTSSGDYEAVDVIDTATARIARLEEALREIATQKTAAELDEDQYEHADFEGGYELLIDRARAALGSDAG